jgi:ethanolamine utilization protein EutQ (cupin superfamily)
VTVVVSEVRTHKEITETNSDRAYYILEGMIVIEGTQRARAGDVVFIPANTNTLLKVLSKQYSIIPCFSGIISKGI